MLLYLKLEFFPLGTEKVMYNGNHIHMNAIKSTYYYCPTEIWIIASKDLFTNNYPIMKIY